MKDALEPSRVVEIELQLTSDMQQLSGVVVRPEKWRFDSIRAGAVIVVCAIILLWPYAPFNDVVGMTLGYSQNVASEDYHIETLEWMIKSGVVFCIVAWFISGRKWTKINGSAVGFSLTSQRLTQGDNGVNWSDIRELLVETSGIQRSQLTIISNDETVLTFFASRQAISWLHRLCEHHRQQKTGGASDVPDALVALRRHPQNTSDTH